MKLPYEPVSPSVASVGLSVIITLKSGKFHVHAPFGAFVLEHLFCKFVISFMVLSEHLLLYYGKAFAVIFMCTKS